MQRNMLSPPSEHNGFSLLRSGEFRAGLDLRILALPESGDFFLMCVGDHEEVRAYVKNNP